MTHKFNISDQDRGFYYAASGNDIWDGKTLETPKQTIQVALDATQGLVPPPTTTLAQVKEAQGGAFLELGLTLYDGVLFEGTLSSIITTNMIGVQAANGISFDVQAVLNPSPGAICVNIDSKTEFGAYMRSMTVGGDSGIGFNIMGTCERIFLNAAQMKLEAENAIGYRCSATLNTPLDIDDDTVCSDFNGVTYIVHDSPLLTDVCSADVTTVCLTGTNTTAFENKSGRLDVSANVVEAEKVCVVDLNGQFSLDAQIATGDVVVSGMAFIKSLALLEGDIVLSGSATLDIVCLRHIGNVIIAPGAVINGIINGIPYGNWIPKVTRIESLVPAITNSLYDPVTGVLKVDQNFDIDWDGEYELDISFSASASSTFRGIIVGVFIDDVLLTDEYDKESKDTDDLTWPSKRVITNLTAGPHNLKVRFGRAAGFGGVFVTLQDVRFHVRQVRTS